MLHSRHDWAAAIAREKRGLIAPRIYYLHPLMAGPPPEWPRHAARCRDLGFDHLGCGPLFAPGRSGDIFLAADHETANPALHTQGPADQVIEELARICAAHGLKLILDLVFDRVALDGALARQANGWFRAAYLSNEARPDPRASRTPSNAATARFDNDGAAKALTAWWSDRVARFVQI